MGFTLEVSSSLQIIICNMQIHYFFTPKPFFTISQDFKVQSISCYKIVLCYFCAEITFKSNIGLETLREKKALQCNVFSSQKFLFFNELKRLFVLPKIKGSLNCLTKDCVPIIQAHTLLCQKMRIFFQWRERKLTILRFFIFLQMFQNSCRFFGKFQYP